MKSGRAAPSLLLLAVAVLLPLRIEAQPQGKTAKMLDLIIPPSLLLRADQVIE
jgi:hypothetical protein